MSWSSGEIIRFLVSMGDWRESARSLISVNSFSLVHCTCILSNLITLQILLFRKSHIHLLYRTVQHVAETVSTSMLTRFESRCIHTCMHTICIIHCTANLLTFQLITFCQFITKYKYHVINHKGNWINKNIKKQWPYIWIPAGSFSKAKWTIYVQDHMSRC